MKQISGQYQDGSSTATVPASIAFDGLELVIHYSGGKLALEPQDLAVSDRLGGTQRRLTWGSSASFVTRDNDGVDDLLSAMKLNNGSGWIDKLERHTTVAIGAAVIGFAALVVFAVYGVPAIAKLVAVQAPEPVSQQLADSTLTTIDRILDPTTLSDARRAQLKSYFREHGEINTIEFRKAGRLGPNALTLSATTVVFTDEIVELAENDEQLLAVYLHELGHARLRHVEQTILQSSAWVVLFSVVLGDVSSAGELIVSLPLVVGQAAYSRKLEEEADQYAIDQLKAAGISPNHLADALLLLESAHQDGVDQDETEETRTKEAQEDEEEQEEQEEKSWSETVFEYLSTHPATADRVRHIRDSVAGAKRSS